MSIQLPATTPRQKKLHIRPKREGVSVKQEPKATESTVIIKQEPIIAHKRQRSDSSAITSSSVKRPAGVITRRQTRQGLQEQDQGQGQEQHQEQGQDQDQDQDEGFDELPKLSVIFDSQRE
jgi:hypothetical protein